MCRKAARNYEASTSRKRGGFSCSNRNVAKKKKLRLLQIVSSGCKEKTFVGVMEAFFFLYTADLFNVELGVASVLP